jgi:hypothetical protein
MEAVGRGAVQVFFAGLEQHTVAWTDDFDRTAASLGAADALEDVDGLAVRVGMPCGAGARSEVDAARAQARAAGRRCDRVDVDRAGEPIARSVCGLDAVPVDLHAFRLHVCAPRHQKVDHRLDRLGRPRSTRPSRRT